MKTKLMVASAMLVMAAFAAMPMASAAPVATMAGGPGGVGCYGYYDYQTNICYGVDSSNLNKVCGTVESACNIVHIAGGGSAASPSSSASFGPTFCRDPLVCCIFVTGPITIYDPTTGQQLYRVTDGNIRVGQCQHYPPGGP
jgi:hypothetical protein